MKHNCNFLGAKRPLIGDPVDYFRSKVIFGAGVKYVDIGVGAAELLYSVYMEIMDGPAVRRRVVNHAL